MNSSKTSQLLIFTSAMKQYMLDIQDTYLEIFSVQKNIHKLEKRINFLDYKYSFDQEDTKLLLFKGNKVFYDFQTQNIPQDKLVLFMSKLNIKMARHNWDKDIKVIQVLKQTKNSKIILVQIQNQYRVHKVINIDALQDEVRILQILATSPHKNILNMERFYFHEEDIYIQFPYIKDGTLYSLLNENPQGLPEEQIQDVMAQILDVINHIHSLGILHKDIKFDNILIEKGQIKIIDFGLAALRDNWDHRCGTCGYMAPEVFQEVSLNEKIDVYSIGVIFHKLLCGRSLYTNLQENQNGIYRINGRITDFETIDLLHNMLNADPRIRFSASDCLAHPFFIKESNLEYQIKTLQMPSLRTPFQNLSKLSTQQRGSQTSQNTCSTNVLDLLSIQS